MLSRILLVLAIVLLVVGSLLTFPAGIPWMVLVWLVVSGAKVLRNRSPILPLVMLIVILGVKNPEWSIALFLLLGSILATILAYWKTRDNSKQSMVPIAVLSLIWLYFFLDFRLSSDQVIAGDMVESTVVCLGDSLTDYGYPDLLRELVTCPVADYGRDGIDTEDGMNLLDEILGLRPAVLILELGGHDYNQGKSRAATYANLAYIINRCHESGVRVILVEIPRGFVRDPFRGLERQLVRELSTSDFPVALISDSMIRKFILFSPICPPGIWLSESQHLSRDGLHPNANGNRLFAETVAEKLAEILGKDILR